MGTDPWCGAFLFIEQSWWPVAGIAGCLVLGALFWLAKKFWLPILVKSAPTVTQEGVDGIHRNQRQGKVTKPDKGSKAP